MSCATYQNSPWPKVAEHAPQVLTIEAQDAVLAAIPEGDRGIFLALAHLGLRPSEARALDGSDYRDGWITIDKAVKGCEAEAPVRGTKTGKPKRLPVHEEISDWIQRHVPRTELLRGRPLF